LHRLFSLPAADGRQPPALLEERCSMARSYGYVENAAASITVAMHEWRAMNRIIMSRIQKSFR